MLCRNPCIKSIDFSFLLVGSEQSMLLIDSLVTESNVEKCKASDFKVKKILSDLKLLLWSFMPAICLSRPRYRFSRWRGRRYKP